MDATFAILQAWPLLQEEASAGPITSGSTSAAAPNRRPKFVVLLGQQLVRSTRRRSC